MGPGRSCGGDTAWAGPDSQTKELTCLVSPLLSRLTLLTSCPSVLEEARGSWGSGLEALAGLEGGLGLSRALAVGYWASVGSTGGSGEAVVGELSGEAAELDVPPSGACNRSVTVVTSWLVALGVGVGSGTSACCSCSSGSDTCGKPTGYDQNSPGWQVLRAGHAKQRG